MRKIKRVDRKKAPMKILHIIPSVSLVYGGPSQMVIGLCSALAELGHQVTIVTTNSNGDRGQPPLDVPIGIPLRQDAGFDILYFNCKPFKRYKFSLGLFQWLNQHVHEYDIAHIHALFSPISSIAATIARRQNVPYVLRPLGTLDPADLKKKQLYAQLLERANLAGASALHFTSDQEAKISERFGVNTIDWVLPLGVQLPEPEQTPEALRSQYNIPNDRPILLYMSRIEPKKGFDLLIPALKTIAQNTNFHFILAGANPQEPDYASHIKNQVEQAIGNDRLTCTGFVSGALKRDLLELADLFVLPSYYENFGIAVAEAMSVGIAVVISDQVHIHTDITRSDSGWVCQCEADSLARSLKIALEDKAMRHTKGQNAEQFANATYSWAAIAPQLIQKYETLLPQTR
jgi:glycosyltransferase involved in cell wall biosynthesis